ncbi:hypothetical protein, partial [Pseudomonas aeruginosa]
YLLDKENEKELILKTIIRYVTTILFSFNQTNTIESFIPKMIKNYNTKKDLQNTVNLINQEIFSFTDDIMSNLPNKKLENKNGSHSPKALLLYRLLEGLICENGNAIAK